MPALDINMNEDQLRNTLRGLGLGDLRNFIDASPALRGVRKNTGGHDRRTLVDIHNDIVDAHKRAQAAADEPTSEPTAEAAEPSAEPAADPTAEPSDSTEPAPSLETIPDVLFGKVLGYLQVPDAVSTESVSTTLRDFKTSKYGWTGVLSYFCPPLCSLVSATSQVTTRQLVQMFFTRKLAHTNFLQDEPDQYTVMTKDSTDDDEEPASIVFIGALQRAGVADSEWDNFGGNPSLAFSGARGIGRFGGFADLVEADGTTKLLWQPSTELRLNKFRDGQIYMGHMDWEEKERFGAITGRQLEWSLFAFDLTKLKCVTLFACEQPCHCEVNRGEWQPRGFSSLSLEELVVGGSSEHPDFFGHNEGQHFHRLHDLEEFYQYGDDEGLDWRDTPADYCAFNPEIKINPVAGSEGTGLYRLASATFNLELSEGLDVPAFFADIIKQTHGRPLTRGELLTAYRSEDGWPNHENISDDEEVSESALFAFWAQQRY